MYCALGKGPRASAREASGRPARRYRGVQLLYLRLVSYAVVDLLVFIVSSRSQERADALGMRGHLVRKCRRRVRRPHPRSRRGASARRLVRLLKDAAH